MRACEKVKGKGKGIEWSKRKRRERCVEFVRQRLASSYRIFVWQR